MPQSPEILFDRSNPVVKSSDYPRSRAFYVDQLGFSVVEEGGEPLRFGIFKRGKAFLFVDAWNGGPMPNLAAWSAMCLSPDCRRCMTPMLRWTRRFLPGRGDGVRYARIRSNRPGRECNLLRRGYRTNSLMRLRRITWTVQRQGRTP